ncbi:HEPN domain protein [uncultured archaeon]|nr:HEPN domain protein [uncultured archaeon]
MKYQEEIQALLKKAERSLRAASSMIDSQDFDFSLSRAYYAMFYSAEALLLTKDLRFSKHSGVIACFGKEFIKEGVFSEQLYDYLIKGFRERQKGDYDVVSMPSREDALEMIERARIFIVEVNNYLRRIGYELADH